MSDQKIIHPGTLINGYEVISLLAIGGYACIYKVKDTKNNQEYAMKTELMNSQVKTLPLEIQLMKQFKEDFFPKLHDIGNFPQFNISYYVMDLLGASLDTIQTFHHKKLDMETVYNVCFNMLLIIQAFHSYGYVHRDIKPGNFLIQNNESCPIVLIDFGISQYHIDSNTGKPHPCGSETYFFGTERFASIDACRGYTQGRKDDLMSWFYTFLDLACGYLPWDEAEDFTDMLFMKKFLNISYLNRKFPKEMVEIFTYLKKLSYDDDPDYEYILQLYIKAMEADNFHFDQFNWRLFYKHHAYLESLTRVISLKHYNKFTLYNKIVDQTKNKEEKVENNKENSQKDKIEHLNGRVKIENKSSRDLLHYSLLKSVDSSNAINSDIIINKNHMLDSDASDRTSPNDNVDIKDNNQKNLVSEKSNQPINTVATDVTNN